MITSVNKHNNGLYIKLYESVENYMKNHDMNGKAKDDEGFAPELLLMDEEASITSLDELFGYMKELRMLKPQLTRLPLDEPCFEINANARTITIPPEFVKNGILSVQGDEIAESIYFRINRFYDHVDLATQEILIQYINAKGEENASIPPVVDIESDPGYIIFEWPISSKVTAAAGNVQFSVRFFTYDDKKLDANGRGGRLVYSLSTLPATLPIKPSHNFDLVKIEEDETLKEDNKLLMENRLLNNPKYDNSNVIITVPEPEILIDLPSEWNLGVDDDGFTTKNVELPVQAISDEGQVTYHWTKTDLNGQEVEMSSEMRTVKTEDKAPIDGKIYYVPIKGEADSIVGYEIANTLNGFDPEIPEYYERVSVGVLDTVGYYQAYITNRIKNQSITVATEECLVPSASEPQVGKLDAKNIVLSFVDESDKFEGSLDGKFEGELRSIGTTAEDGGKLTFQWLFSPEVDGKYVPYGDIARTSLLKIVGDTTYLATEDTENSIAQEVYIDAEGNEKTGEDILQNEGYFGTVNDEETKAYFQPAIVNGVASGDGYYKLQVINNLNKTQASTISEDICRVTHPAVKPEITAKSGTVNEESKLVEITREELKARGLRVEASSPEFAHENRTEEDYFEYQWYRYSNKNTTNRDEKFLEDIDKAYNGLYVVNNDYRIYSETSNDKNLILTEDDLSKGTVFFCRVVNNYNGSKAIKCSKFFKVLNPEF